MEFDRFFYKKISSLQQPIYKTDITKIENEINKSDGVVTIYEIKNLSNILKQDNFILQMGECAESFAQITPSYIEKISNFYDNCIDILSSKPLGDIIKIPRIAGQFAKPRSDEFIKVGDRVLPNYRGDIINGFDIDNREFDPSRMIEALRLSKIAYDNIKKFKDFFISHEALLLAYEANLCKEFGGEIFDTSAHFLWIGDRTKSGGHIYLAKMISNPIGIKVGINDNPKKIYELIKNIGDKNISLIFRLGKDIDKLYEYCEMIDDNIRFMCDPMHANTQKFKNLKIRYIEDIKYEILKFYEIVNSKNKKFGGLNLEVSSDDIYECIKKGDEDRLNFKSLCDPRLNCDQVYEILSSL